LEIPLVPTQIGRGLPRTLKLVTNGRKTGLPHIVELRYASVDGSFFLLSGNSKSDWALNMLASKKARVRIGERIHPVAVTVASNSQRDLVLEIFRRRYGSRTVNQWYSDSRLCLRLDPIGLSIVRGSVRGESEARTSFAEWRRMGTDYYHSVEEAFDSASEEYDYTISRNYINTWIRKRSISELLKLVKRDDLLLEIGCGTGTEALEMCRHVRGVVATDISGQMLTILKKKSFAKRLQSKIVPVRMRASQISEAKDYFPEGTPRIAYSLNGALNCEPELDKVPKELSEILSPHGYFVCSIRNTLCLSEALSHSAVLQLDRLNTRKNQPTMVSVGGRDIPSFYYPPDKFARIFRPFFEVKKIIGLPAFMPPAYLNDYYFQTGVVRPFVEKMETVLGGIFPFNRLGDQTMFVFQRK
jgi:deazaflavin-dependent oxidoreductase (nitroreductase family)